MLDKDARQLNAPRTLGAILLTPTATHATMAQHQMLSRKHNESHQKVNKEAKKRIENHPPAEINLLTHAELAAVTVNVRSGGARLSA